MGTPGCIRTAHSNQQDARLAVRDFHSQLRQDDMSLVLFFCSSEYDLEALADEMNRLFPGVTVVGCTTAGEIGPGGYQDRSLSGASFPGGLFTAVAGRMDGLQQFELSSGQAFALDLMRRLEALAPEAGPANTFAFLMIDGLSVREEMVVRTVQTALRNVPLLGGSAGDDLKFACTWVFHDGRFHTDSAVLILASTSLPFRLFKTQHFISDNERLVVTEAEAGRRIVREINGLPAAEEYARVVGVPPAALDPTHFAASPVVVLVDGADYVRAIQKVSPDGSLTFFCAIDEGLVLRVARGNDLLANLQGAFEAIRAEIGPPELVIGCDCILRKVEMMQNGLREKVAQVFKDNHTVGFSTYGEQFRGVHVNQTFTGIAIGGAQERGDE